MSRAADRGRLRPLLVAALLVSVAAPVLSRVEASAGCAWRAGAERDVWQRVGPPAGQVTSVTAVPYDACVLLATTADGRLWRTTDSGGGWRQVAVAEPVGSVAADPRGAVVVASAAQTGVASGGGTYVSRDGGETFTRAADLGSGAVVDVAHGADDVLYAALAPTAGPSLYRSADGGRTWSALTATAALHPLRVVADATDAATLAVVVAVGPQHRLVLSSDAGTTFRAVTDTDVVDDVDSAALSGGGAGIVVAGPGGLMLSSNHGTTWQQIATGVFTGVRYEAAYGSALMAVRDGHLVRSANSGVTTHPAERGLPPCAQPALGGPTRDAPSVFLARCGDAWYRYRGNGSDLGGPDAGGGGSPDANPTGATNSVLVPQSIGVYKTWPLPHAESPDNADYTSASLAWDGETLYYTAGARGDASGCRPYYREYKPCPGTTLLHELDPRTGRYLGALRIPVPNVNTVSYDARRDVFYVTDPFALYSFGRVTHRVRRLFDTQHYALQGHFSSYATFAYDPAIDRFRIGFESRDMFELDLHGTIRAQCSLGAATPHPVPPSLRPFLDATPQTREISAIVPTGQGGLYVQMEDDAVVYRVDRSCHASAAWIHRQYAESTNENDAMACDATSFALPVIWMRDAQPPSVSAYALPGAYCALPTSLRLAASPRVTVGSTASLCGTLTMAGTGRPVAGQQISVQVAGSQVGIGRTDASGTYCVPWRTGLPDLGTHPVLAVYVGTPAYRPASATGAVTVTDLVPELPAPEQPLLRGVLPPVAAVAAGGPPAPPAPVAQPAPQAQGQPQPNPGQAPQALTVAERERSAQTSLALEDDALPETDGAGRQLLYATALTAAYGTACAVRRRNQSRTARSPR